MLERLRVVAVTAAALVLTVSAGAAPAYAAGHGHTGGGGGGGGGGSSSPSGYDISYPQCNGAFPTGATFGIVGVNAGIVYSANPCLGTGDGASQLAWAIATGKPQFYANTADPGPLRSSYWTFAGLSTNPEPCTTDDLNSLGCNYDYGWYAAADSFKNAVAAEQQVNASLDVFAATTAAASAPWWLDVETGNSWEYQYPNLYPDTATAYASDVAALQGAVGFLTSQGVVQVGFYSTGYQWGQVTGGDLTHFTANPNWVAGFSSAKTAASGCTTSKSFTGGTVTLTQYVTGGYDADHACP